MVATVAAGRAVARAAEENVAARAAAGTVAVTVVGATEEGARVAEAMWRRV